MFNTTDDEVEGEAMPRRRKVKRRQKGGNLGGLGALLNAYAVKSVRRKKRKQRGRGLGLFGSAAKIGVKLGKDKRYKRMGAIGVTGSYNRRYAPWEV